jgi:hypothetical protein
LKFDPVFQYGHQLLDALSVSPEFPLTLSIAILLTVGICALIYKKLKKADRSKVL